jgi:hypothetical protein
MLVPRLLLFLLVLPWAAGTFGQPAPALTPAQTQALVERAITAELAASQDQGHPMRYRLLKTSPRLSSVKEMVETRDGAVARLISINGQPLSPTDERKEQARLDGLLSDPGRQRHRKQSEDEDTGRALKVLRALPRAFLYRFEGAETTSGATIDQFSFKPNPDFDPPDLETQVLTAMSGKLWVDETHGRVTLLQGTLQSDVDFGWGILGRLSKGGTVSIQQADIGGGQWRIVQFKMAMSGRVLFKTKVFDTEEEESGFAPVALGMSYGKAIELLRAEVPNPGPGGK